MLFAGLGDPMYLTFDGRVIILDMLDEVLPREAVTLKEAATAIAAGAKVRKFPQLLSLLPESPSESEDCLDCEIGGWLKLSETITIVCGHCGGLGWKQIEKGQLKWQNKK